METNAMNEKGTTAVEFAIVLPIAALLITAALAMSLTGVRGIVAQHAATRAARVAHVFQDDYIDAELHASLPPELFRGGATGIVGERIESNELPGAIELVSRANALFDFQGFGMSALRRSGRIVPALPKGLGDAALNGGDTPSPYCRRGGGYEVCGFDD